jgi:ABC-2 type transport system ATP-binding protein
MKDLIETIDLTKIYKLKGKKMEIRALNDVNLSIKEGEIFGLLGPNGAGKTTLIQILTTITQPTSGHARVDGYDVVLRPKKVKSLIGLMLASDMLYYRITGYDNLKFFCKIYKIPHYKEKINKIAEEFGLTRWMNQYVEFYSSGMKMKLALCRTLLLERPILFLDEPTLGLDVKSTSFIIDKLRNLNKTILLTSHDMSVVEKLCDRVAFINLGNILKVGTKNEVKTLIQSQIKIHVDIKEDKPKLKEELIKLGYVKEINEGFDGFNLTLQNREHYTDLISVLNNYKISKINEPDLSLEELFLKLIV